MAIDNPDLGKVTTIENSRVSRISPISDREELIVKVNELATKANQLSAAPTELPDGYVTTAKLADEAVTTDKLDPAAITAIIASALTAVYPIGSIYTQAAVSTNPGTLLGFGTWTAFGTGRVLVGVDAGQGEFDTLGETGGAKTHTLITSEMPSHRHAMTIYRGASGGSPAHPYSELNTGPTSASMFGPDMDTTGGDGAHNNLQPYITVYMWRRTA